MDGEQNGTQAQQQDTQQQEQQQTAQQPQQETQQGAQGAGQSAGDSAEAESVAIAAEKCIRDADWEAFSESGPWRIAGIDTSAPELSERDSSGRYVWQFEVNVTAVRLI